MGNTYLHGFVLALALRARVRLTDVHVVPGREEPAQIRDVFAVAY